MSLQGISVIFRVALGLLQLCEEDLLATDMEGMLKVISSHQFVRKFDLYLNWSSVNSKLLMHVLHQSLVENTALSIMR
jgi:hypothetical protein